MAATSCRSIFFKRPVGLFSLMPINSKLSNSYVIKSNRSWRHVIPALFGSTTCDKKNAAQLNWQRRVDLATLYRALEFYNLHEGIDNHVTMMAPAASGKGEVMLVNRRGLHWREVTPSSLLGLNSKCEVIEGDGRVQREAATIHKSVHDERHDALCCIHLHMPYATALGFSEHPHFGMYHQNHCRFYKKFTFDRHFGGLSKSFEEGKRIAEVLGKDKMIAFLCNHGVLIVAPNAAQGLEHSYFLERACMHQMLAMSSGQKLYELPEDVVDKTCKQMTQDINEYCQGHFESVQRLLMDQDPNFKSEVIDESYIYV